MKLLSINIPTYNRAEFLIKNLSIIANQLNQDNLIEQVEINISDNASTDGTESMVNEFVSKHAYLDITYHKNDKNLGPDLNFISAMQMAHGEYSILFGDDDYFEKGAISKLLHIADTNKDVTIFFSNRINVNAEDKEIGRLKFMREDISTQIFDFSHINDGRSFFAVTADHGGILTFISSVLYKTSILKEVGEYNNKCTGSCYSFLYYWWSAIVSGNKLMYLDDYYVRATIIGVTNNNYGQGIKRLLVDTEGLSVIADVVFSSKTFFKSDFLSAVRRPISNSRIYSSIMNDNNNFSERLYDSMISCGWSDIDIKGWKYMLNKRNSIKSFIKKFSPYFISKKIHF